MLSEHRAILKLTLAEVRKLCNGWKTYTLYLNTTARMQSLRKIPPLRLIQLPAGRSGAAEEIFQVRSRNVEDHEDTWTFFSCLQIVQIEYVTVYRSSCSLHVVKTVSAEDHKIYIVWSILTKMGTAEIMKHIKPFTMKYTRKHTSPCNEL